MKSDPSIWSKHIVVGLLEHGMELVKGQMLGKEFVRQFVDFDEGLQFDNARDVSSFEPSNGQFETLLHAAIDPLANESVEVNGPTQKLNMSLTEQSHVAVGRRTMEG